MHLSLAEARKKHREALRTLQIAMFYRDHNPPHFHVRYNEYKAIISITDLAVLDGKLPPKVLGLVIEWASKHKEELLEDWRLAEELSELKPIAPLE